MVGRVSLALVFVVALALTPSTFRKSNAQSGDSPQPKFLLYGNAADSTDPELPNTNPDNQVVRFDTRSGAPVGMIRKVNELVRELDNQIEFKYFMQDRNCGAGSPRIDLFVDVNNDGQFDGVLEGHVQPNFMCVQNRWVYQDLTDDLARWGSRGNLPGGPGNIHVPWNAVEATFGEARVLFGQLVEDSQAFKLDNRGFAYYDLVSIGNRTYDDHSDSAGCNPPQECPPR